MSVHSSSGTEWERLKRRVWARDGDVCQWCGIVCDHSHGPTGRTVDHLIPRSKGGEDTMDNCITSCRSDNSSRQAKDWIRKGGFNPAWFPNGVPR